MTFHASSGINSRRLLVLNVIVGVGLLCVEVLAVCWNSPSVSGSGRLLAKITSVEPSATIIMDEAVPAFR